MHRVIWVCLCLALCCVVDLNKKTTPSTQQLLVVGVDLLCFKTLAVTSNQEFDLWSLSKTLSSDKETLDAVLSSLFFSNSHSISEPSFVESILREMGILSDY